MKTNKKKSFIEELAKTPIVQHVCEKLNVSRNTFYNWIKEDNFFALEVKEALDSGIDLVNDYAESGLLNAIKRSDLGAIKYWLSCRHSAYKRPFIVNTVNNRYEAKEEYEKNVKEGMEKLKRFQDKWFKDPTKPDKERAQELLEKWKKEYLDEEAKKKKK